MRIVTWIFKKRNAEERGDAGHEHAADERAFATDVRREEVVRKHARHFHCCRQEGVEEDVAAEKTRVEGETVVDERVHHPEHVTGKLTCHLYFSCLMC